jgi:hypothetical protein
MSRWNAYEALEKYPDKSPEWHDGYLHGAMHEAYGPDSASPDLRRDQFAEGFRQGSGDCAMNGMSGKGCARIGLPLRPPFRL